MDSHDPTPPMYHMEPPFPDMQIGKIRILYEGGEIIGELIPYHFSRDQLFGARIDIVGPPIYNSGAKPIPIGQFADCGHFTVTTVNLSEDLLRQLQRTDNRDFPYALDVRHQKSNPA